MNDLQNFQKIAVNAKQLFLHASSHAGSSQPVDQMIALHDMHNAVEWLLSGMWAYYYETEDKPFSMMQVYDRISKEKQKLIHKREMSLLNDARNQAQHHAVAPSTPTLQKYLGHCEAFLRESMRGLSAECEYDELYMGLLLPEGLIFQVRWEDFSDDWISVLGGRRVPALGSLYLPNVQSCALLDLRIMVIQAERMLPETLSENLSEKVRAIRLVVNILAACLVYAQNLAVAGVESSPSVKASDHEEKTAEAITRPTVSIGPEGQPFPPVGGVDFNVGFGVGELLEALTQIGDFYDGVERRIILTLESLALGIDQGRLRQFQILLSQANEPAADVLSHSELLWCYDFVLEVLLTLAPLIQRVPEKERVIESDIFG